MVFLKLRRRIYWVLIAFNFFDLLFVESELRLLRLSAAALLSNGNTLGFKVTGHTTILLMINRHDAT